MPEQDHDRLEQFFRKAANRPEVAFNEEDWKKLERRLDAVAATETAPTAAARKGLVISVLLLLTVAVGIALRSGILGLTKQAKQSPPKKEQVVGSPSPGITDEPVRGDAGKDLDGATDHEKSGSEPRRRIAVEVEEDSHHNDQTKLEQPAVSQEVNIRTGQGEPGSIGTNHDQASANPERPERLEKDNITRELKVSDTLAQANKQEAVVELPGAEEADAPGVETMVKEKHASDQKEHVATPRLSLLLSYAPDFSATSLNRYSAPGRAYGAMIHYHAWGRWSLSAGVIQNSKQYTGDGEDYHPPAGYWKYYTNGIIPESIDGSCMILEFPVMVQYTLRTSNRNRWILGAGASSYLMQSESYRYTFEEPNPGAKEGWKSKSSSSFLFNMMNFTVGYEYELIPGLMLGIEPYVKIPLEKIGWSNLKLYSTGASITLRYTLIRKQQAIPLTANSRGPD